MPAVTDADPVADRRPPRGVNHAMIRPNDLRRVLSAALIGTTFKAATVVAIYEQARIDAAEAISTHSRRLTDDLIAAAAGRPQLEAQP